MQLQQRKDNLESEANELEGIVTWFCIHLEDAETNSQLHILRDEVIRKRKERETLVHVYTYIVDSVYT